MDNEITYKIIRSRRRTVSVIVERDGSLVVRAPLRYPEKSIEEFVFKKREWILHTVERVKRSNAENMFSLENGAKIELLGKAYTVRLTEEKRAFLTENEIVLPANLEKQAFEKLMQNKTSFIVAHRLSTIKNADLILVMNKGNVIEKGTHAELLEKGGFYANLYNSQFEH